MPQLADTILRDATRLLEAKVGMYHGTSSVFLPTILTRGLQPEVGRRVWGDEPKGTAKSLQSFGGIYLATQFGVASQAAANAIRKFGGREAFLVVQVETRTPTITVDEDLLPDVVNLLTEPGYRFGGLWTIVDFLEAIRDKPSTIGILERGIDRFIDQMIGKVEYLERRPFERHRDLIAEWILEAVRYQGAYLLQVAKPSFELRNRINLSGIRLEPFREVEREYRAMTRKLIETLKQMATAAMHSRERFFKSLRVTEPIGFRGANKIIAAYIRVAPDESRLYAGLLLVYGRRQKDFETAYRQHIGGFDFFDFTGRLKRAMEIDPGDLDLSEW